MSKKSLKIRPLGGRLVVEPEDLEAKTPGGILIPDTADKDKPMMGFVLAVGEGRYVDGQKRPLDVKVGEKVLFGKYAGTNVKFADKEYLVMNEDDVMGVVED